ncbi:MAG: hypothetical protein ACI31S_04460 [Bacilli bacterium]
MAYYLTIKDKNNYRPLDISSLPEFKRSSNLRDNTSYTLEEIDSCTSKYDSEYTFRETLYKYGIINIDDITKNITIRHKQKDSLVIVRNGIAYSGESKYLDKTNLRYILLSKQNDFDFLQKLISYYRNSYCNRVNIGIIESMLNRKDFTNLYLALRDFYEREVYSFDSKSKTFKLKYKSFHDLAMFICRYDERKELERNGLLPETYKQVKEESLRSLKAFIICEEEPKVETPKVKKRSRKYPTEIEGQMSLFY